MAKNFVESKGARIGVNVLQPRRLVAGTSGRFAVVMACQVQEPFRLLSASRPVAMMDMRGQTIRGSKLAEDGEITLDGYMADIDAVRKDLGAERIALFGYSPGGFFLTHYAIRYPKRVSALILAEPAIYTDTEDLLQRARLAEAGDGQRAMEAMLNYIDPSLSKTRRAAEAKVVVNDWESADVMGKVFRLHAEHQIRDEDLKPLAKVPTLLIGGTESPMNFHVRRISNAVPNANVWWIRGASHLDLLDAPNAKTIASVANQFLSSVST